MMLNDGYPRDGETFNWLILVDLPEKSWRAGTDVSVQSQAPRQSQMREILGVTIAVEAEPRSLLLGVLRLAAPWSCLVRLGPMNCTTHHTTPCNYVVSMAYIAKQCRRGAEKLRSSQHVAANSDCGFQDLSLKFLEYGLLCRSMVSCFNGQTFSFGQMLWSVH